MMARNQTNKFVFGIHVGNTSACLALFKDGKIQVIANDVGDRITPTLVAVKDSEKVVGMSAKAGIARNHSSTVVNNKRLLNNDMKEETFADIANKTPYKIVKEDGGLKYLLRQGETTFIITAESVAVAVFSKLFEIASSAGNFENRVSAVLCCPVDFPQSSRCILKNAAEVAGFEILHVISEPSATALAYSVDNSDGIYIVYRIGGATMDVSIVQDHGGLYSIQRSVHLSDLGGDRFTTVLVEYLAKEYRQKCRLDPFESRRSLAKLTSAAETCKHVLSTMGVAHCFVESLCEGVDFSHNVSRARFESLISPIMHLYIEPIKELLQMAQVLPKCIKKVLLSGGSVKIPKVQQALREMFPLAAFPNNFNSEEVIAIGAAKHASYLHRRMDPNCESLWREVQVTAAPIVLKGSGITDEEIIIRGFSLVPVRKFKKFSVPANEEVSYEILEYVDDSPVVERTLGKLHLGQVTTATDVFVEVSVNRGGGLSVAVTDSSGHLKGTLKLEQPHE